jgi:hypothetical protein
VEIPKTQMGIVMVRMQISRKKSPTYVNYLINPETF